MGREWSNKPIYLKALYTLYWLVVSTYPSEKYEFVSWDDDIPNIWKNKCSKPPTSIYHIYIYIYIYHTYIYIYIYITYIYISYIYHIYIYHIYISHTYIYIYIYISHTYISHIYIYIYIYITHIYIYIYNDYTLEGFLNYCRGNKRTN